MNQTPISMIPNTSFNWKPKGTIQFSNPVKPRPLTPKSSQILSSKDDDERYVLFSDVPIRSRGVSFNVPSTMSQSSIFFGDNKNEQNKDSPTLKKLQFKPRQRNLSFYTKNITNDLSKFVTPVTNSSQHLAFEKKANNNLSIKVSQIQISNPEQKLAHNSDLKRPFAKQKIQFSSIKSKPKQISHSISDFIIGKKLGKGNFGDVFLAQHKNLGFIFALKIIPKKTVVQKKMQRQLLWQSTIQMSLIHPNIVSLYGMFYDEENIYLVQQLITEGHLYVVMKQMRKFSQQDTASIIKQVCSGVEYMHRMSVIHRDLKPQNILIQFGVHKLCDFGWAIYTPDSLRNTYCGTPLYMSPQIIKGQKYSMAVDNWALGILTYQLLFGRSPFKINSSQQLTKIITQQVKFPQYIPISCDAQSFILELLNKNPQQRTQLDMILSHPFFKQTKKDQQFNEIVI